MATEKFKRKLTAILSADVKGYSRLMGEDEEGTIRTLNAYLGEITGFIQKHQGRLVVTAGDSVLADFASVVDAVRCAVEIQEELKDRNKDLPEGKRMEFRIGVNLGDVVEEGDNILGDGVNVAARVQSLAEAGGICISESAYQQIKNKLAFSYDYVGEQAVKNIAEPVRVYRVRMEPEAVSSKLGEEKMPVGKRLSKAALAIIAVVVIAGLVALYQFALRPSPPKMEFASKEKMAFPLPDKPSIAVLPFVNMSDDPKQEHFADGMTEEVISTLSRIPTLFVIASNSVFTYKGKPVKVQQVSQELGVRYVLEGSVRRSQDRVRVTAQLIDAVSGHHLWSEKYDRMLKEIFAVQDEITHNIVTALRVKLAGGESIRIARKTTDNVEAWEYYIRGADLARWVKRDENVQAQELFEKAIALDPKFAAAYALLSLTHAQMARFGWSASPEQSLQRAFEMAQKAIALDDSLGDGHAFLGFAHMLRREYEQATAEGERGVVLTPNGATPTAMLAMTLNLVGRTEEAIDLIKRAMRLNPSYPPWYLYVLGQAYRLTGRYTEAIPVFKAYRDLNPNAPFPYIHLAVTYSLMGQQAEARAAINEALRLQPTYSLKQAAKAYPYKSPEVLERELEALRKAGLK